MIRYNSTLSPSAPVAGSTVFNVKDFGAKMDGTTDDTTAWNNTITAAKAAGGGIIRLTKGTLRTTAAALTVTGSNIHVEGEGRGVSKIFFDTTDTSSISRLLFDGGVSTGLIYNVGVKSLTVYNKAGVGVSGFEPGYRGEACLITFRGCMGYTCEDTETYNSPNFGVVALRSFDGFLFRNFTRDNIADGYHVMSDSARCVIMGNHSKATADDGIGIAYTGFTNDISVIGNTIDTSGSRGIAVMGPVNGCTVMGNTIRTTWLNGILVECYKGTVENVNISGNTIINAGVYPNPPALSRGTGVGNGILLDPANNTISNVTVTGNVIKNARNGFIWAGSFIYGGTGKIYNLKVSGNVCEKIAQVTTSNEVITNSAATTNTAVSGGRFPGIGLSNCVNPTVTDNTIDGAWHEGIHAKAGNSGIVKISGNLFNDPNISSAASTYLIRVDTGKADVTNNSGYGPNPLAATVSLTDILVNDNNNYLTVAATVTGDTFGDSANRAYGGGNWNIDTDTTIYSTGHNGRVTNVLNAFFDQPGTGSRIQIYMPKDPACGNFEVQIDGVSKGTFSMTAPRQVTSLITTLDVAYGSHNVRVINKGGGTGGYCFSDKIVFSSTPA